MFDPLRKKRSLAIKFPMNNAFRSYKALSGRSMGTKLTWNSGQCPQQVGPRECGYYVMRFMFEIAEKHHSSEDLATDFSRTTPYAEEEINEVRDIWAEYFVANIEI